MIIMMNVCFLFYLIYVDVENMMQRMTIIGMILRFRQLIQEALHDTLVDRIPFLLSSILDFHEHAPNGESIVRILTFHDPLY